MTHPGVGPLTALAYVLIIGTPKRFQRGKQIGTYVGMIPSEDPVVASNDGAHQQARQFLVALLAGGGGPSGGAYPSGLEMSLQHLAMRRHKSIAKVAMGRRMAIKLYWMWRNGCEYSQSMKCGSYAGQLGTVHGVK